MTITDADREAVKACFLSAAKSLKDSVAFDAWLAAHFARHREAARREALEEAARACLEEQASYLSPEYATGQPLSSLMERLACSRCATAIRALIEKEPTNAQ